MVSVDIGKLQSTMDLGEYVAVRMSDELKLNFKKGLIKENSYQDGSARFSNVGDHAMQALNKFRRDGDFCDVTLEAEGKSFPAHRNILAANCQFFHNMFTSGMKESKEKHLKLTSLKVGALETLLDYFYTCSIVISMKKMEEILEAASFLLLDSVKGACARVMQSNLNESNCCFIKILSDKFVLPELSKKADDMISKWFRNEELSLKFLDLPVEAVTSIISRDDLLVENEEEVYFAVLKWVGHDFKSRNHCLKELFDHLRYGSLSVDFLKDQLANQPLLKEVDEASEALKWHLLREKGPKTCSRAKKRPTTELKTFIAAVNHDKLFCLDVQRKVKISLPPPSCNFSENHVLSVIFDKNTIFAKDGKDTIAKFEFVDRNSYSSQMCWEKLPPYKLSRELCSFAVKDGRVYVIGGRAHTEIEYYNSVECYDIKTKEWSVVGSLGCRRVSCGTAITESHVFAIGGMFWYSAPFPQDESVEKYDPMTNKWEYCAPLQRSRINPLTLYAHGKIYVVGGASEVPDNTSFRSVLTGDYKEVSVCNVYDPIKDEWESIAPLPSPHLAKFSNWIMVIDNIVHVIDCERGKDNQDEKSYKYDSNANSWTEVQVLGTCGPLADMGLCALQMKSFFIQAVAETDEEDTKEKDAADFSEDVKFVVVKDSTRNVDDDDDYSE